MIMNKIFWQLMQFKYDLNDRVNHLYEVPVIFPTTFQEPAIFRDRESDDYGEDCVIYSRHPLLFVGSRDRKTSCVHV